MTRLIESGSDHSLADIRTILFVTTLGDQDVRPQTIIYFEWIIFATLLLGFVQSYLAWDHTIAVTGASPASLKLSQIFTAAIIATLTLLVSRRRSKIAMWVSIAMFALGLPVFISFFASGLVGGSGVISAVQVAGQLVAYGLLFTASARRWMNKGDQQVEQHLSAE
ncbi:hypothetical protein ACMGDH_04330 [Sphingomonas sp. DT-207]|uniref:hypothetical protein n=1 Tax=Sphingomonas sp. DT-207 TaxID=3396167 RepID=UPI003F1DE2D5